LKVDRSVSEEWKKSVCISNNSERVLTKDRTIYCWSAGNSAVGRRPFLCFIMLLGTKVFDLCFVMLPHGCIELAFVYRSLTANTTVHDLARSRNTYKLRWRSHWCRNRGRPTSTSSV